MPLRLEKQIDATKKLAVWEISEPLSFFLEKISIHPDQTMLEEQQLCKACTRFLINHLLNKKIDNLLAYSSKGQPLLDQIQSKISISHSKNWVSVYIDTNPEASNIGIDIEFPRPNILKLASKFISPSDIDPEGKPEMALLVWSAKEVLYKIYAEKALDFKTHLSVQNQPQLKGIIQTETTQKTVFLEHLYLDNKLLVWSL